MKRWVVVGLLLVLVVGVAFVPFWQLGAIIALAGVMLATLLIASHYRIFWIAFLHPHNYGQAARRSLAFFAIALLAEVPLLIASLVMIWFGQCGGDSNIWAAHNCSASEDVRKYLLVLGGQTSFALMAVAAVVAAIAFLRALILLAVARATRPPDGSGRDQATVHGADGG